MVNVRLRGVEKTFKGKAGITRAIDTLDLEVPDGQLLVLLGPSGCGKTTILRSIAGLETPNAGTIELGNTIVLDAARGYSAPPRKRDIGMVFQSYALWPHMTVRENIAFPLRARGKRDMLRSDVVKQVAELVEVDPLLDRYPGQLSGGQQQRVALARGLVAEPGVLLLDEPLSNLDARLRSELRVEIRNIHQRIGFTGVYVTHDQVEAFSVADLVVVMGSGRILQIGTPEEVYSRPASVDVARFLGINNVLHIDAVEGHWQLADASSVAPVAGFEYLRGKLEMRFRSDALELVGVGAAEGGPRLEIAGLEVSSRVYAGQYWDVGLTKAGATLTGRLTSNSVARVPVVGELTIGSVPHQALTIYQDGTLVERK